MYFNNHKHKLSVLFLLLIVASGRVRSSHPDIERGSFLQFQDGYPEARMGAIGLLSEEDKGLINVTTDIVLGSLIYSTEDDRSYAEVSIEIRVLEIDGQFTKTVRRDFSVESDFEDRKSVV